MKTVLIGFKYTLKYHIIVDAILGTTIRTFKRYIHFIAWLKSNIYLFGLGQSFQNSNENSPVCIPLTFSHALRPNWVGCMVVCSCMVVWLYGRMVALVPLCLNL